MHFGVLGDLCSPVSRLERIHGRLQRHYPERQLPVVDMATITDGTSNTAMFSETHVGAGPGGNAVTISTVNGRGDTYMWRPASGQQTTGMDLGAAGVGIALAFVQSCQAIPGNQAAFGTLLPPNGCVWIGGNPGSCMHLGRLQPLHAPQHDRLRLNNGRKYRGLWLRRRRVPAGQQPPRRHQSRLRRRFGQVHQELDQSPDLVGHGNQERWRTYEF